MSASSKASNRNRLGHVKHWAVDSNDPSAGDSTAFNHVDNVYDANIVTSELKDGSGLHSVVLDIDMDAELVPSSTPGHFHLYIDKAMTWEQYQMLLSTLSAVGIIEPGYEGASNARGFTAVRLPWVKKPLPPQPEFMPMTVAAAELKFSPELAAQKAFTDDEPVIPGTDLPESTVRSLVSNGLATEAERTWLMILDAAKEAASKPVIPPLFMDEVWPTTPKEPY